MLEVFYAGSGEKAAEFEYEEIPDASVNVLKQSKTTIGTKDAPPTIPATAPPR